MTGTHQTTSGPRVIDPAFGAHALPFAAEALRRLAEHAPRRFLASGLRRLALAGRGDGPFDCTVFGSERARLHPRDNRTEKRVFAGVRWWDRAERARLAQALTTTPDGVFHFVDAGANVGMYTLALLAEARRRGVTLRALAVEPDPTNGARLEDNLAASGAVDVTAAHCALGATEGMASFVSSGLSNRGEARLAATGETGAIMVPVRPLLDVVTDAGLPRIDAIKMDIEGQEVPVLSGLLAAAPRAMLPRLCVLEVGRDGTEAVTLMQDAGYALELRTRLNAIMTLPPERR
ncbi:MAG: FkbM family methyltransferase [Paracoccaceae bacterium]|jgi:FkbM family methyltransferase